MSTTINKEEIQKFSKLAEEWWDVNGKFKPLHMFNPIRIEYITEKIKNYFEMPLYHIGNIFNPYRVKHMQRFKFSINIPPFIG